MASTCLRASFESNEARKHVDAMRRHRQHVVGEIAELERRQDELLDQLTGLNREAIARDCLKSRIASDRRKDLL